MKLLVIGSKARVEKYLPDLPITREVETVVVERGASDDEILDAASDADFIMADAISPVSARLIESMPNLKLIHSEGVAYNAIDLDAARARSVLVCNNAGANAVGVAEQTVLLMLACLRDVVNADAAVRDGRQIQTKERMKASASWATAASASSASAQSPARRRVTSQVGGARCSTTSGIGFPLRRSAR
mgnify:CR=1 FL=1